MLWRYGLLVGFVTDLIRLGGNKMDELCAAIDHKLPGIVGHPYVRQSFFDHFVDSCSRYGEVVVISRRGSHSDEKRGERNRIVELRFFEKIYHAFTVFSMSMLQ